VFHKQRESSKKRFLFFRQKINLQVVKQCSIFAALLFFVLLIAGCLPRQDNLNQIRMVELQTENQRIQEELTTLRERMQEISASRQGVMSQQIVEQPVIFEGGGDTLQEVRDRQILRCGGNADLPGFGYLDPDSSEFVGFDIDICRAVGAAVLGEQGADQYEITPLTSRLRFTALQSGDVDLLTRNTTWTLTRDSELHADYAGVTFYDGQGVMVRKSSNINKLSDLRSKAICAQAGSTSAANLIDYYDNIGISIELQDFDDRIAAFNQYSKEGCDAYTGDKSSLLAQRLLLEDPSAHQILIEDMSREPLGPVVRHEDNNWKDVVSWTIQCLINAEAFH